MASEQYRVGTVTVTTDSNVVEGFGTTWQTNIAPGHWFKLDVDGSPIYTVLAVDDDTHLRLTVNYAGANASGQPYMIQRSFTPEGIPLPFQGDADLADILRAGFIKLSPGMMSPFDIIYQSGRL